MSIPNDLVDKLKIILGYYQNQVNKNNEVINEFDKIICDFQDGANTRLGFKIGGTIASVAGAGCLVAAPITGGASIAALGFIGGIGGLATNVATEAIDVSKSKDAIGKVKKLASDRDVYVGNLKREINEVTMEYQGFLDKEALGKALNDHFNYDITLREANDFLIMCLQTKWLF